MGCIVFVIALIAPRLALFLLFLFSDWLGRAYETNLWPFLGFFFMPLTTLCYAAAVNWSGEVRGLWFFAVLLCALSDLGVIGGSGRQARRRRRSEA